MMNKIQIFALSYLLVLAVFIWGMAVGRYEVFPYEIISSIKSSIMLFAKEDQHLSAQEKILSDLNVKPSRFLHSYPLTTAADYRELQIRGIRSRREPPRMKLTEQAPKGYRVLFGAFDFEETFWGALLIDSAGEIVHQWRLSSDDLPLNQEPGHRKNMYGIGLLSDGSVIFSMQEPAGGIVKADVCSRSVWSLEGKFHHTVSVAEDEKTFWTFEGDQVQFDNILALVDVEKGNIIKRIDMKDVRAANPDIDVFQLQKYTYRDDKSDSTHGNDIDPLPASLRDDFREFEPGDLLLSFRVINLVMVLNPNTLKIKWWRVGVWAKQHDPDWNKGGLISVFDNDAGGKGKVSHIKAIDPQTYDYNVLVDGSRYNFFSIINGEHQLTEHGTILITSNTQGRVFEVDGRGEVVFDFLNVYDFKGNETLHMSKAIFLSPDFFNFDRFPKCGDS